MHCIVLHCIPLYCIVLNCIVLYCIVLYCFVFYCDAFRCGAVLCGAGRCGAVRWVKLYCIVLYCIVLYCIVLYCIVLYCIVLYCIVLYCIVLYCIVLYCIVRLSISLEKTEVLFQRAPNSVAPQPAIFVGDVELKVVDNFKYLGSLISVDGSLDKEIAYRISKGSQALGRLRNRLLNHHNVALDTKLKVYRAVVLSSLLYGCETWTVYRRQLKQLERFHQRALRSILGIRWQDRATNTEVFKRTNCISIEAMLLKSCLCWTGHVIRMEDQRIPKQLLFGELEQGHRRQGRPCKRFKDTVKAGLQWCDIPPTELVATALDRQHCRTLSQSASSALEEERRHQAQSARERRHLAACIPATNANFQCPDCARLCKSRIGLQRNSRTHR